MRKKYCTRLNKAVYAKTCVDCSKLAQTDQPIRKTGTVLMMYERHQTFVTGAEFETGGYECEHLFEKVVFKGPHTDKCRKRFGLSPEPAVGAMLKYQYGKDEIDSYSG